MKTYTYLFTFLTLFNGLTTMAQCDIDIITKLSNGWNSNINHLKTYDIEITQVNGIPINKEYSYVLTANREYYFTLYHPKKAGTKVKMDFLNNSKYSQKLEIVKETESYIEFSFLCKNTGIYYFLFYTSEPTTACATMQLSSKYEKSNKNVIINDCFNDSNYKFLESTGFKFLKSYNLNDHTKRKEKVRYSYVFTKNREYMIQVFGDNNINKLTTLAVLDENNNELSNIKSYTVDNSTFYLIPISTTGIYYLEFTNNAAIDNCHLGLLYFKTS